MKRIIIVLLSCLYFQVVVTDPLLVVVLMVKNESSVIEETLQPFIEGGVCNFVIFDTGSTDGTQEIAADLFKNNTIEHGYIVQEAFVDFATSRNRALTVTQDIFPDAIFMLMPDAEWYMHNVEGLLQFCKEHQYDDHGSYLVSIKNDFQSFYTSRLIRCRKNIKFVGRVHETLNEVSTATVDSSVYFEWGCSFKGMEKSRQRWLRDRDLLLKEHTENPSDLRSLFYLAQTYECLGDLENAYYYYEKRAAIKGWYEEDFITRFRLGRVAHALNLKSNDGLIPLEIQHYLIAFSLCPHRAEPLVNIAQYYIEKGDMHSAFLYASRAVELPYPTRDILFVEKYIYDFVRYDLLGICAWYVGEYDLGEWAVIQALEREPELPHLWNNLKLYVESKKMRDVLCEAYV